MKVTALAALALFAVNATAHTTIDNNGHEYHVTEVETQTVDCTDEVPLQESTVVETRISTHVHQLTTYTLPGGFTRTLDLPSGFTVGLPTGGLIDYLTSVIQEHSSTIEGQKIVSGITNTVPTTVTAGFPTGDLVDYLTSVIQAHSSTEGQKIVSVPTSTSIEVQPTVSSGAPTAAASTEEEPVVYSTALPVNSTNVQSTFVTVHASSDSADALSQAPTQPAPTPIVEQSSTTNAIVGPAVGTETPLINPLCPSVTHTTTSTTSITLTTTGTLPGVSSVHSVAHEAIIPSPPKTHGGPPVFSTSISNTVTDLSTATKTLTHSNTIVVTVTHTSLSLPVSAEDCHSTVYVTVYSPPSSPPSVATASAGPPAIAQNSTIIVATGVPYPNTNTTINTNTTTVTPPIHGAAPTLSATPGLMLAFCGLICYLI
ncbi:hypothetical protein V494_08138 [Pseudogymnoascus sp. VKM F-4513 (FW-928)]|nr:hypothetical protein V494_08138 [Pseudogymnoascus sp. VKM F-4513 (FW-928)]